MTDWLFQHMPSVQTLKVSIWLKAVIFDMQLSMTLHRISFLCNGYQNISVSNNSLLQDHTRQTSSTRPIESFPKLLAFSSRQMCRHLTLQDHKHLLSWILHLQLEQLNSPTEIRRIINEQIFSVYTYLTTSHTLNWCLQKTYRIWNDTNYSFWTKPVWKKIGASKLIWANLLQTHECNTQYKMQYAIKNTIFT